MPAWIEVNELYPPDCECYRPILSADKSENDSCFTEPIDELDLDSNCGG